MNKICRNRNLMPSEKFMKEMQLLIDDAKELNEKVRQIPNLEDDLDRMIIEDYHETFDQLARETVDNLESPIAQLSHYCDNLLNDSDKFRVLQNDLSGKLSLIARIFEDYVDDADKLLRARESERKLMREYVEGFKKGIYNDIEPWHYVDIIGLCNKAISKYRKKLIEHPGLKTLLSEAEDEVFRLNIWLGINKGLVEAAMECKFTDEEDHIWKILFGYAEAGPRRMVEWLLKLSYDLDDVIEKCDVETETESEF